MIERTPKEGGAMDIGRWLQNLGLGQYEAAFRANEIDDKVLRTWRRKIRKDRHAASEQLGSGVV